MALPFSVDSSVSDGNGDGDGDRDSGRDPDSGSGEPIVTKLKKATPIFSC